jgi:F420 biosynthesis protein FbiB-like protein
LELTQAITSRRSIRKFKRREVPRGVIRSILDLARWAPSAHNAQPWRLIVIDDEEKKAKLAVEMGEIWLSDMLKDGVARYEAEATVKLKTWTRITNSPIVIIACLDTKDVREYSDTRREKAEYLMAVQSVAVYIQTLLLAAHNHKLGACWLCAPLFCQAAIGKVLGLPKTFEPQAMIIIGYPDETPTRPQRKPLRQFCELNRWPRHRSMSSNN